MTNTLSTESSVYGWLLIKLVDEKTKSSLTNGTFENEKDNEKNAIQKR